MSRYRYTLVLFIVAIILNLVAPVSFGYATERSLPLSANAAVLVDGYTGVVLYSHNATCPLPPASTTKVLTAILGLELGSNQELVTIDSCAASQDGTSIYLKQGDVFRMYDLVKGALICSGNDSATAIAIHLGGSERQFAGLMNYKAQTVGSLSSCFYNPHGLPQSGHQATAYDLAMITRYSLQNRYFRQIVATGSDQIQELKSGEKIPLYNTNRLLGHQEQGWKITGVKTGTTSEAGECLIAVAEKENKMLISVVLGSSRRYIDTMKLMEYGSRDCCWCQISCREPLLQVPVWCGSQPAVAVAPLDDISFAIPQQLLPFLEKRIYLEPYLKAPCPVGTRAGRLEILLGRKTLFQTNLVTLKAVARKPWYLLKKD